MGERETWSHKRLAGKGEGVNRLWDSPVPAQTGCRTSHDKAITQSAVNAAADRWLASEGMVHARDQGSECGILTYCRIILELACSECQRGPPSHIHPSSLEHTHTHTPSVNNNSSKSQHIA